MATRKKKTTPAKADTAMVKWDEELAAIAAQQAGTEKPSESIKAVRIQGSTLMVDDEAVPDNLLDVVVLAGVPVNTYYEGPYDLRSPQAPLCYAYGDPTSDDPEASMKPHPEAKEPQHDNCAECPWNQWGSDGRGKACKNGRRLGLLSADAVEDLAGAETRVLNVSPTNIKHWAKYLRRVTTDLDSPRPTWGVVTRLQTVPDPKSQYRLTFERLDDVDFTKVDFTQMKHLVGEAVESMTQPFPEPSEEEVAPRKKAPARKAPAARSTAAKTTARKAPTRSKKF